MNKVLLLLILALTAVTLTTAQDTTYEGISITVLTQDGPPIAEPLRRRAPEFTTLTGAEVTIATVPFAQLYQAILDDQRSGDPQFDAYIYAPQWMVDYLIPGYLEDLTPYVEADAALLWEDIASFFRTFSATYEGRIYAVPLDGDFHMLYYRADVLEASGLRPPKTWDDYLAVAAAVSGQDMNGDGVGDFGSCIAKAQGRQSYWWIFSIAGAYLQSQGTSQGVFFDLDTFEPLVNNQGFIRALQIYAETGNYGPPDERSLSVDDIRTMFISGRCALALDWGNIGALVANAEGSVVQNKVGAVILPGSTSVVDRATGALVPCDNQSCPFAFDGVNHAPFAAFGGWSGSINAGSNQQTKDAAYAFLSFMAQPQQANIDVTIGATGFNPYRISQFENLEPWLAAGFSDAAARDYLGAIEASLSSPNMILDLRIPHNQRYQQVVLDAILSQFLAGEYTAEQAAQAIYDQWEAITEALGRDAQLQAYKGTIGAR